MGGEGKSGRSTAQSGEGGPELGREARGRAGGGTPHLAAWSREQRALLSQAYEGQG